MLCCVRLVLLHSKGKVNGPVSRDDRDRVSSVRRINSFMVVTGAETIANKRLSLPKLIAAK